MAENETWRTANVRRATAARMRTAERKQAEKLRARGWTVTEPTDEAKGGDEATTRSDNA